MTSSYPSQYQMVDQVKVVTSYPIINCTDVTAKQLAETSQQGARPFNCSCIDGSACTGGYDADGAMMYIVTVVCFYALGIICLMIKYLQGEHKTQDKEKEIEIFLKNHHKIREEHSMTGSRYEVQTGMKAAREALRNMSYLSPKGSMQSLRFGEFGFPTSSESNRPSSPNLSPTKYLGAVQSRCSSTHSLPRSISPPLGSRTSVTGVQAFIPTVVVETFPGTPNESSV